MNTARTLSNLIAGSARRIAAPSLVVAILVTGCASSSSTSGSKPAPAPVKSYAGLVTHPELLRPSPGEPGGFGWVAPDANMKQYDKILLDRILVHMDQKSKHRAIDPVTIAGLVEFFRQAIVTAFEPKYTFVEEPGPGVLVARITLFDLVPTNVTENVVFQALPFGAGVVGGVIMGESSGEGFGSAPYLGQTGITLQLFDSQTKRLIAEFADTHFGKQYVIDLNKDVGADFSEGTSAYMHSFSKWSYAKDAFAQWAQFFRKRLDQLRAK